MTDVDAVIVGSGPNGLAAAVTLAQRGLSVTVLEASDEIGGGTRTKELTVPGLLHDVCSAVHPFGVASPFLRSLPLEKYGLQWRWPEVDLAHPLDGGRAGALFQSLDRTAEGLGVDGRVWRRTFAPFADRFDELAPDVLGPVLNLPHHPVRMARFGLHAGLPATWLQHRFKTAEARALFAGTAAHIFRPLNRPTTAAVGMAMISAGHQTGWPVAAGGSHSITKALAALLEDLGGTVHTGVTVTSLKELPPARVRLFDTSPIGFARIAEDELSVRQARPFVRWKHGPAVYKLDIAVAQGIPWTAEACRRAGTVHVGGDADEIGRAEAEVCRGRMPERPFVLVAQQYLCDETRSVGDTHPVWAYAHVPSGYAGDGTDAVLGQIERFAPGFRERILGVHVTAPGDWPAYNANYVGGDIATGANTMRQLVFRPRIGLNPYATGLPGTFLCSAATPPGAGVHGMCGHLAARRALSHLGMETR